MRNALILLFVALLSLGVGAKSIEELSLASTEFFENANAIQVKMEMTSVDARTRAHIQMDLAVTVLIQPELTRIEFVKGMQGMEGMIILMDQKAQKVWTYIPLTRQIMESPLEAGVQGMDLDLMSQIMALDDLDQFDVVYLGEEKLDGEDAYLYQMTQKEGGAVTKLWFSQTRPFPLKLEEIDTQGRVVSILRLRDVVVDGPVTEAQVREMPRGARR